MLDSAMFVDRMIWKQQIISNDVWNKKKITIPVKFNHMLDSITRPNENILKQNFKNIQNNLPS